MAKPQILPQPEPTPNVHKFGGSSLKDAKCIEQVVSTIKSKAQTGDFVVVSANGKVTDLLLSLIQGQTQKSSELKTYLIGLVDAVLEQPQKLSKIIEQDLQWLSAPTTLQTENPHKILALGELWSAQILSARLIESGQMNQWLDGRDIFAINRQNLLQNPANAKDRLLAAFNLCDDAINVPKVNIVTGYIARDLAGKSITLGRNGSDYTATLIADLVASTTVYLWTDVDGVYTADPNVITAAQRIECLTLAEAQALSELGSNVLHHKTIAPILHQSPRLKINSCGAATAGTVVEKNKQLGSSPLGFQVKTLACKNKLVFLSVGDVDELKARQIQAQLTAEQIANYANHFDKTSHTLSFYVEHGDGFSTSQWLKKQGLMPQQIKSDISLLSAVGENIRQNHQVISKILNRSAVYDVHNIHYPANDHTLCVLLPDVQAPQLLQDLHHTFFGLEPSIPIVVLGYGNIGQQFLKILNRKKAEIEQQVKRSLSVVAVANSRFYQFNEQCLLTQHIELIEKNNDGQLLQKIQRYAGKPLVLIDLTASEEIAALYLEFAQNNWHLISANKIAAADCASARQIENTLVKQQKTWLKNTTVGAALPVQNALRQIRESGDQIKQVSGVFSGTLSWLFGHYDGQKPFMDWVKQAHKKGYSEPDPRDDLSGEDVYRKALILARECGFEPVKINFKPVLPQTYLIGSIEDFWQQQDAINVFVQNLWEQAQSHQQSLCYLATVNANSIDVELVAIDHQHAAAGLKPGDNVFVIESSWYAENPLVIQGPGAGKEVTAAGVLNDLMDVLRTT